MKWIKLMLITAMAVMVVGCDSSKGVVEIPGPTVPSEYYSAIFKPFKENVYKLIYVEVTRKSTGEVRRYQQDRQVQDFLKKGEPYNFVWRYAYLDGSKDDVLTKTDLFLYTPDPAIIIKFGESSSEVIELPY